MIVMLLLRCFDDVPNDTDFYSCRIFDFENELIRKGLTMMLKHDRNTFLSM